METVNQTNVDAIIGCVKKKKGIIEMIGKAIVASGGFRNVTNVQYRVFQNQEHPMAFEEFLVITYSGGARSINSCNGNSDWANLRVLAEHVEHGEYGNSEFFEHLESSNNYKEIS